MIIKLQSRGTPNANKKSKHTVFQITIPKSFIENLKWKKQDKINIKLIGNRISLKKHEGYNDQGT